MSEASGSISRPGKRRFTVDSFFVDNRPQAAGVIDMQSAKEIRLDRIIADPHQPRRTFDQDRLEELAASIGSEGVLQPIVVRYESDQDLYVIVHGERRWRASQLAGLPTIPAMVREVDGDRLLIQQLMENIVREDLNAVDRAAALQGLKSQMTDATWDQVAAAVGIKRSRLFQLIGTTKLPDLVQEDIQAGRLSEKQTRPLHGLLTGHQLALRDLILSGNLTVEETARLARMLRASSLPDHAVAATEFLASRRDRVAAVESESQTVQTLAGAIVAAASGGRAERASLKQIAISTGARPYNPVRFNKELLAVTRSLARTPVTELAPGTANWATCESLRRALAALLDHD